MSTNLVSDARNALRTFARLIGDPERDRNRLLEISPAYPLERLRTPALVVYDDRDHRVDPDHAHRVLRMLELLGKPHEERLVAGAAHSLTGDQWIADIPTIRRFLTRHLFPGIPFTTDDGTPEMPDTAAPRTACAP